jgi:peptidoglycan/LPS O-acetylase OafA/YrhL
MQSQKNIALEGLRGLACMNVVFGHFLFCFFPYLAHHVRPYPQAVARYAFEEVMMYPPFTFLYLADAAVSVFFVLSGYVLTRRFYETGNIREFEPAAVKRYVRLGLPVFASVMFAWVLFVLGAYGNHLAGPLGTAGWVLALYTEPVTFVGAVFRGLIGAPLFGRVDLNGPLWSLQIEIVGSILLFACYSLFAARSKLLVIFWFVFFAFVISGRAPTMLNYVALLAGSLLHLVQGRLRHSPVLATACLILGLLGVSFTFAPFFAPLQALPLPDLTPYGPNLQADRRLVLHTLGATLLVAGVVSVPEASRILASRLPVYLGRISFAVYLLHFPLIMSLSYRVAQLSQWLGASYLVSAILAFVALMITLLISAELFYRFVDAPSARLGGWLASGVHRRSTPPAIGPVAVPAE